MPFLNNFKIIRGCENTLHSSISFGIGLSEYSSDEFCLKPLVQYFYLFKILIKEINLIDINLALIRIN